MGYSHPSPTPGEKMEKAKGLGDVAWLLNIPASPVRSAQPYIPTDTVCMYAATQRWNWQVQLATLPSLTILTLGQPVPALTRGLAGESLEYEFLSHWYDSIWKKVPRGKVRFEPKSASLEADALPLGH